MKKLMLVMGLTLATASAQTEVVPRKPPMTERGNFLGTSPARRGIEGDPSRFRLPAYMSDTNWIALNSVVLQQDKLIEGYVRQTVALNSQIAAKNITKQSTDAERKRLEDIGNILQTVKSNRTVYVAKQKVIEAKYAK